MFLAPFVFLLLTSLMTSDQALTADFWPRTLALRRTTSTCSSETPLPRYLLNTVLYAVARDRVHAAGQRPGGVRAGEAALARPQRHLPGDHLHDDAAAAGHHGAALPDVGQRSGLTGTLWPLILPMLLGDAFSIFLLRQFLLTIPDEYLDAARVDGCGEWRTLLRVVLPMARPGIAAAGACSSSSTPGTTTTGRCSTPARTRATGRCRSGWRRSGRCTTCDWNLVTAATVLTMVPVIVMFFFAQKAFVQGVTLTGVKG